MNKNHKGFAGLLLAVTLLSALTVTANAGTAVIPSTKHCSSNTFTTLSDVGYKSDTSPLSVYITAGEVYSYRVRALGCPASNTSANSVNKTYFDGAIRSYVTCNKGTQYRVRSRIREDGYDHASLAIYPLGYGGNVTVKWSPDTASGCSYPVAAP